LEFSSF